MSTPAEWEKYSFPSREEHFRALARENPRPAVEEEEAGDGEEGEGSGDMALAMESAQMEDLWVFDRHSRSIHSSDGRRQIALSKLDTPSKVIRFLVTLEQRQEINPLPIIRALEEAARFVYEQPLTDVLSHHASQSTRMDWDQSRPAPVSGLGSP